MDNRLYVVTGCTGYVGNVPTKKLMEMGCRVVGLARDPQKVQRVFGENPPKIVYGDIRDPKALCQLFEEGSTHVVIHTVAYVTIGEGSKKDLYDITVEGTRNMIEAALAHQTEKFLHISSSEALPKGLKLEEDMKNYIPRPEGAEGEYSRAKSMADVAVLEAVREKGLPASLLLLAGVLGPGDYSRTHMTQVIIDFIEGRLPASVDGGYNDFDIRDVADVLPAIVENAKVGESYIFANKPDKINEVLGYVAHKTGRKLPATLPIWIAYVGLPFLFVWAKLTGTRPLYTGDALKSLRKDTNFPLGKSEKEFGYHPRSLQQTVEDHVDFLVKEGMVTL